MNRLTGIAGIILLFASTSLAQQTVYFPQIANGMENGNKSHWHTTIFVDNHGTGAASGTISLINSDGTPMQASFVDESGNAAARNGQITFQLGAGQTHKYTSTAATPLQVGYGVMTTNAPVAANVIFSHYGGAGAEYLIAEAGAPSTTAMGKQAVFVDTQFGFNSGIAIANPSSSTQAIALDLVDANGRVIMSTTQTLGPGQHFAKFLTEIFPNVPSMAGRLQFRAGAPLAALALRFDRTYTLFTTLFPFRVP
jgi:chitodextrinase